MSGVCQLLMGSGLTSLISRSSSRWLRPAKTEYYEGYDDPTADMVVEVKEGVKFRVHSYLLKAHRYVYFSSASKLS